MNIFNIRLSSSKTLMFISFLVVRDLAFKNFSCLLVKLMLIECNYRIPVVNAVIDRQSAAGTIILVI
jgi:hypothetical protein